MKTKYTPASFTKRLLAFFVDGLILSSFTGIVMYINAELILVISFAYFIFLDASKNQGTFGKQLLGIKIVDKSGERLSYLHAAGRHVCKYFGIMLVGIGYIGLPFKMTGKRALVDTISKCQVVNVYS